MPRSRLLLAGFFLSAGIAHLTFLKKFFESIVPGWVPGGPAKVNTAAGVAEFAGGALVLVPGAERYARPYLIALLLGVFPANIQMAVAPDTMPGARGVPRALLWARLPLQVLPILWVRSALRSDDA
ncbi:hypothetical protein DSM112329_03571 [Paraconexibacter sp. AEG42_29]|uniref:DoxX family membrane protein n=1 Tax=Paraconexibacter sp. AEG42_29 TaxID=2997339 RepID=A0AAU7AYH9_9ACTN